MGWAPGLRTPGTAKLRALSRWVLTVLVAANSARPGESEIRSGDWAACGESSEWSAFRQDALAERAADNGDGLGSEVSDALARKARALLKRWQVPATQWLSMLGSSRPIADDGSAVEQAHCGAAVDISRGVLARDISRGFHPYHLLTLDKDSPAWFQEDFLRWRRDFCYLGYVVALYVRAASRLSRLDQTGDERSEENMKLSRIDLQTASSMLGRCREMDFLDRSTWGVHSIDIDLNLLRVGAPLPQPASGEAPPFPAHFGPWRGLELDLPEEHRSARQNLWQALANGARFRRGLESQVARKVASGELTGWQGPRPFWRGRPIHAALFAVPVWYATEFLVGLFKWRFPALPLSVLCAPLGGYNLPRSNELRDLVEPLLTEPAELRPLRLIEGYCCDWDQVDFLVVRRALRQLARTLASFSLLVCAGPLWLCLLMREGAPQVPMLAHCLTFQDLDLQMPFEDRVAWVHRKVLENFGGPPSSRSSSSSSGGVSGVLVQDDMQRVYYPMAFDFSRRGNFSHAGQLSFFQMPYIQARYTQRRLSATWSAGCEEKLVMGLDDDRVVTHYRACSPFACR